MKRIQSACLEQTISFAAKDAPTAAEAARLTDAEYRHYLAQLDRGRTAYKVLEEQPQEDGSLLIRIKRQYNSYDTGEYLD